MWVQVLYVWKRKETGFPKEDFITELNKNKGFIVCQIYVLIFDISGN